jgi:hemolysin activation/secretion protein
LTPDDDFPNLRYAVFSDIGNTYDSMGDIRDGGLKAVLGVGIRWKIPAFVRLDLRIDYGVSLSDDSYRVSANSRHAF